MWIWAMIACLSLVMGALTPFQRSAIDSRHVRQLESATVSLPASTSAASTMVKHRCNNSTLEQVMLENIGDDAKQSKLSVMEAAERVLGGTFNVVCAHGDFSFITSTNLYCLVGNENVKCYAFLSDTTRNGLRL